MTTAVRPKANVKTGGLIEVRSDELPEGAVVDVIVLLGAPETQDTRQKKLVDITGHLHSFRLEFWCHSRKLELLKQ